MMTRLAGLLGDVRAASASRYDAHDSAGNRMDTAKVITSPTGGYLAVYHDGEVCHLAASTNLMEWTHRAVVDEPATQPTIAATGDGGLLTAAEFNDGQATAGASASATGPAWTRCWRVARPASSSPLGP